MNRTGARKWIWILAVVFLAVFCLLFAAKAGKWLVVDTPLQADVIVVLAGETNHRPARGLELLKQGYGRKLIIDVPASAKIYEFSQVQLAQKYIQDLPQSASMTVCPIEGLSTRDESRDVERCLAHEEGTRVLIVTSDFHTRRALSIFRHEVRGKKFSVVAAHDETQFGTRWWSHRQWAKTCLDEWLRLFWWTAVDRWR